MTNDSAYLLKQVKLKSALPTGRFDDDEILEVADDVVLSQVVPLIISLREEFFVTSEDQAITANQKAYPVPYRAMGLSLREVKKVVGSTIVDMDRMSPEEITTTQTGNPNKFYLESMDVILYPTPSATRDSLRLSYYKTPSKLKTVSDCGLITAIDTGTGVVTANCPTTWTTGDSFDFVSKRNGHRNHSTDLSCSSVSTTSITFAAADLPSALVVGDYVTLAGESPFVQLPDACFDLVVRLTVNDLLESMGDQAGLQAGLARTNTLQQTVVSLLTNRVAGALKKSIIKSI